MHQSPRSGIPRSTARTAALVLVLAIVAAAQDAPPRPPDATADPQPAKEEPRRPLESILLDAGTDPGRYRLYGHLQSSFTWNASHPHDHQDFGRLFDDRSDELLPNQLALTFERPLAPEPDSFDWGFKIQPMFGSDARFIHALGVLDNVTLDTAQPELMEGYLAAHLPLLSTGGIDVKAGVFATLCGYEVMDAEGNPLLSHTYMFNFAIPFKHAGVLATAHLTDAFDLHAGIVNGINTGIDDNNDSVSFHGGFGLRLFDSDLTLALGTHFGPENPRRLGRLLGFDADEKDRLIFDLVVTGKPADRWTLTTDMVYARDQAPVGAGGVPAEWYGIAQYVAFDIRDDLSLVLRGEIFRDDGGFAVAQFAQNDDLIDVERGLLGGLDPRTVGAGPQTYTALTFGVNWRPDPNLRIGAEVRYDHADGRLDAFNDSRDDHLLTVGLNVLWTF